MELFQNLFIESLKNYPKSIGFTCSFSSFEEAIEVFEQLQARRFQVKIGWKQIASRFG